MKPNKENKKIFIQSSAVFSCLAMCSMVYANTPLADYPVLGSVKTPGNLALALSVEYPTALTTAHQDATYTSATEYLGYFDPQKCYSYVPAVGDTILASAPSGYFKPATQNNKGTYTCSNGTHWSGNFLNWATTSTIDPFRWAMTGGRRVVDTPQITILEKSYHSNQGSFAQKSVTNSATIAAATPSDAFDLQIVNNGLGYKTNFTFTRKNITTKPAENIIHSYAGKFQAKYWNYRSSDRWGNKEKATLENANINYTWNSGTQPHPNVNEDFSSQFIGTFIAQYSGEYTFGLLHDDYAELIINTKGNENFNRGDDGRISLYESPDYTSNEPSAIKSSTKVFLKADQTFTLRLRHYDSGGPGLLSLFIKEPGSSSFKRFETVSFNYEKTPEQTIIKDEVITQEIPIRVQVCEPAVGLEENCKKYSQGYKPEGLIQQYADEMRYSAFGYLNDHAATRDGGVMRAKMKSVGMRDFNAASNDAREWDMDTGVFITDPDKKVPSSNNTYAIKKSGVINYLNDFGQLTNFSNRYKAIDPVGEMYYGILRYFRGEHDIPEWSNVSGLGSEEKKQAYDGFPIFSTEYESNKPNKEYPSWKNEAVLLSCQKNFILGIGDTNTHKDKNLPSGQLNTSDQQEPGKPQLVKDDKFVNAVTSTKKLGTLENHATLKNNWLSGSWNGNDNSPYMAGLAYHANFFDQRSDLGGDQTIQTFWVDVMENNDLKQPESNQFYLATKYGGVDKSQLSEALVQKIAAGDAALTDAEKNQLADAAWKSPRSDWDEKRNGQDYKPKSFFTAGNPSDMIKGLSAAFENFSAIINAYSTTLSLSTQNLSSEYTDESLTYSASYQSNGWQGDITARALVYDDEKKTFALSKDPLWQSSQQLTAQFSGTGWDTKRNIVTSTRHADGTASLAVAFRHSNLTSHQKALLSTNYSNTDSSQAYVDWLRGDTSQEGTNYRKRTVEGERVPLGDIINSKIQVVGAPQQSYSELDNPGYKKFKADHEKRDTMIYVGANDGMLHAIRGGEDATQGGTELFAYIPSELFEKRAQDYGSAGLLAHLGNPNYVHKNYVDATPKITDIDFNNTGSTPPNTNEAAYQSDWRTVLIGGLGSGGRSYYAIDVTNPKAMTTETSVAAKVLWEFPAKSKLPKELGGVCTEGCIDMGYSYADPVVVKTAKYGWVAIFTSGYNNKSGQGHVFIVNPKDGSLLQTITTGNAKASGMAHATAYVPDYSSMTAESLYVGDLDGQLWRFDLTGTDTSYPAPALLASVGKAAAASTPDSTTPASASTQPITSKPLVEIHPITRQRFVMFGTGKLLHGNDVQFSHRQAFYAIQDGTAGKFGPAPNEPITAAQLRNASAGSTTSSTTDPKGWYLDFGADMWRLVSDPISSRGLVAFSAVQPLGEHCKPSGQSRVYILDYANGKSRIVDGAAFIHRDAAVTELSFLRVGGKLRLAGGDAEGQVTTFGHIDQNFPARSLGWREVPVAQ